MREIISGKQDLKRIVSIEIVDDTAEILTQNDAGDIEAVYVPNEYWILADEPYTKGWIRLNGDLHYKYAKKFSRAVDLYKEKRFLRSKNADFYSIGDPKESFMVKNGYTYYHGLLQKDVSVLSFDIETTGLEHNADSKILIISNTFRKNGDIVRRMFTYDEYADQGAMLVDWCKWVRETDPSIICGHNIYSYDLPYMQHVADMNNVSLELGRNDSPIVFFKYDSKKRIDGSRDQDYHRCRVYGREVIDTMFLAINYDIGRKYESYALKKIIAHEGLEVKDRQFYDAASIRDNYTNPDEWVKIKKYALHDADDALAIYDLMSPTFFYLAQSVPKPFQGIVESASGSQINAMMVRSYLQIGHSLPKATPVDKYEGAISFGNPGIWRNAFKVDVASLYPSIMIQYEVYNREKDPKGHMLEMVKIFTAERLKNKKIAEETGDKYYDDMQNSQKVIINSFYGFLGAEGLLFNSGKDAAFVTQKGREILQISTRWAIGSELIKVVKKVKKDGTKLYEWVIGPKVSDSKGFSLVNCDTDSIMFCFQDFKPISEDERKDLLNELNSLFPERIRFADDGYYETAIVFKAKNYALYGWNKKKQKMEFKTKGSALKDAKKERALKEFMNRLIDTIIQGKTNYSDIYHDYIKEAMDIKDIGRWSSKKTISQKVLVNDRTNEVKIRDAIAGEEIVEGDKVFVFFKPDGSLCLMDKFNGEYDREAMVEKVYKAALTFQSVIPKDNFLNYALKRNKPKLEQLVNGK